MKHLGNMQQKYCKMLLNMLVRSFICSSQPLVSNPSYFYQDD